MQSFGRVLMTFVLVGQAALGFLLDWSPNHLLNPAWHPHARFHGALLLFLLAGSSATCLWLLWRPSQEPRVGLIASAAISAAFWMPFFFVTALLPGSTLWAGNPSQVPQMAGHHYYPNVAVAGLFLFLIAISLRRRREAAPS
jgi:hypothetical protein